jgi:hypothetical protein
MHLTSLHDHYTMVGTAISWRQHHPNFYFFIFIFKKRRLLFLFVINVIIPYIIQKNLGLNTFDPPIVQRFFFFFWSLCGSFYIVDITSFMIKDGNSTTM